MCKIVFIGPFKKNKKFMQFETPPFYFNYCRLCYYATNCFMLIIRGRDYEINFSHGNLHEILGFDKKL
jgi:hypothetical protein